MTRLLTISFLLLALTYEVSAQTLSQTIRGTVIDRITHAPLFGANIIIAESNPLLGAASDPDGIFRIAKVPVGKHTLKVTYLGYKERLIPNVVVNSGKEVVLVIELEEDILISKEVVISGESHKERSINEMATVSTRTFSVEETQKFAAAVNDPARMASSFAGVTSADDGNNTITIRGNSPAGLQWKMEGIEIPNPNHFAAPGASGGGISILSAQTMSNSDFMTGAFAAEYGNALSGIFDIRLRKGNNEKPEYTLQAGLLGLEAAAEGPIVKGYQGSYLVNYRYSTLSILDKIGVEVGDGTNDFQDLSYNVFLPTKKAGNFTLFGFGGLSTSLFEAERDSSKWEEGYQRYDSEFTSNTGVAGVTHSLILGKNSWLKSAAAFSGNEIGYKEDRLNNEYVGEERNRQTAGNYKLTVTSAFNHKLSSRHNIRTGFIINQVAYDVEYNVYDQDLNAITQTINDKGDTYSMQFFAQSNYYITKKLTFNGGLHYLMLNLNKSYSLEPRLSFKYEIDALQSVSAGYGLHSQIQPLGVYFAKNEFSDKLNKDLGMSKAHHLVLGYDRMLAENLRLKAEAYAQWLFDIPVRRDTLNSFSMVNVSEDYITDPLKNSGTGTNYGLEVTVEQFLKHDFYFLLATSLYDSKYKGSDNVERNTRFNGQYGITFTGGKEVLTGSKWKNRVLGFNLKTIYRGGFRGTPVDLEASQALPGQGAVYVDSEAFSIQYPDYFRADIRISLKRNRKASTQTLALDIQNVTNRKNIYGRFYDSESGQIKTYYQTALIPILSYKIEF
jgi:hypothetical protein